MPGKNFTAHTLDGAGAEIRGTAQYAPELKLWAATVPKQKVNTSFETQWRACREKGEFGTDRGFPFDGKIKAVPQNLRFYGTAFIFGTTLLYWGRDSFFCFFFAEGMISSWKK